MDQMLALTMIQHELMRHDRRFPEAQRRWENQLSGGLFRTLWGKSQPRWNVK